MQRTPQGGIRVPAALTRTGVFIYTNPDGSERREYRPPSEVIREDSVGMLSGAPVTNLHPPDMVDPDSYRDVAVGHVVEGSVSTEGSLITADLVVQDAHTIRQIEDGARREVSCGYLCDLEHRPGTTPEGERYDAIQTRIRYNHVALVPRGRAGAEVSLRLDSAGNQIRTPEGEGSDSMKIEIIGGTEYEVGTPAHREAIQRRDAAEKTRQDAADKVAAERDTLRAENEQLKARLDAEPERFREAVRDRVRLLDAARDLKVEVREDMDDQAIKIAILGKLAPRMDCADKSDAYVDAALDLALQNRPGNAADVRAQIADRTDSDDEREDADDLPPDVIAREEMIRRASERRDSAHSGARERFVAR